MRMMMTFGTMTFMIKSKRIHSSTQTTNNMMRTGYGPKTMGLMTLTVKKVYTLMGTSLKVRKTTIWAVKRVKMLMMTNKRNMIRREPMMIALAVTNTAISTITSQTTKTALKLTVMLLILQEQQWLDMNNTRKDLLLDLPEVLQQYQLRQDLHEIFLDGCLPVVT